MERNFCCHLSLDVHKMNMKFRVQNLTVLCSSHKVFYPAFGQHLLWLGGNIGEFYTSKYIYIYRAIFSCSYPTVCSIFSSFFTLLFVLLVFYAIFSLVYSYYRFSIFQYLLHVLFAFFGNVVQQAMVCRRWRKGRWISVFHTLF